MMDLMDGALPTEEELLPADWAWAVYRHQPEFLLEKIEYNHFQKKLKDNREQVAKKKAESARQMEAYRRDLDLYPVKQYKKDGRPVFSQHPAHELLQTNVKEGVHEIMDPFKFKMSREEYKKPWYPKEFRDRMHQEVRAQKFNLYVMKEAKKRRPKRKTAHEGRQQLLKDAVDAFKEDNMVSSSS